EYDVSFWFLVSLSLFFAMLVGDGGYGILVFVGTYLLRRKRKTAAKEPFLLLYVFSASTIGWGLITGTWFGVERLASIPTLNRLVVPALNSYSGDQDFMIGFCFILGAVHLSIAHVIRAVRFLNSPKLLAEVGWILILWFLYFLAGYFVLGRPLPEKSRALLSLGLVLVALFSNPKRNFVKSALLGVADLPFNIIRSFSDLVSYLRLFAVGYATLVIAVSFNQMAFDLWKGSMLRAFGALLILLIGHTLNIMLAAMAVLVHGIRLNMLEFSSHLGMNWTGQIFRPFMRRLDSGLTK
ncbi:MAG: V-type ATP synthase subunit I, partial [Deltaproteobacteria bacterium]|nr:V-type ATP synthase subunit I [Deltaproteobacteria bacterium]